LKIKLVLILIGKKKIIIIMKEWIILKIKLTILKYINIYRKHTKKVFKKKYLKKKKKKKKK